MSYAPEDDNGELTVTVIGEPRTKQSARFQNGRVVSVAKANRKLGAWTKRIMEACKEVIKESPERASALRQGALRCDLEVYFGVKDPKKHWKPCTRRVDRDNLLKAVADAVEATGLINDDSQITEGEVTKRWGPASGVIVRFSKVEG